MEDLQITNDNVNTFQKYSQTLVRRLKNPFIVQFFIHEAFRQSFYDVYTVIAFSAFLKNPAPSMHIWFPYDKSKRMIMVTNFVSSTHFQKWEWD